MVRVAVLPEHFDELREAWRRGPVVRLDRRAAGDRVVEVLELARQQLPAPAQQLVRAFGDDPRDVRVREDRRDLPHQHEPVPEVLDGDARARQQRSVFQHRRVLLRGELHRDGGKQHLPVLPDPARHDPVEEQAFVRGVLVH